jgi:hypothetical protein
VGVSIVGGWREGGEGYLGRVFDTKRTQSHDYPHSHSASRGHYQRKSESGHTPRVQSGLHTSQSVQTIYIAKSGSLAISESVRTTYELRGTHLAEMSKEAVGVYIWVEILQTIQNSNELAERR